jgi:histidyl-tRNA synthetase
MLERMKVAQFLWKNNFSAEFSHLDNPKFKKQLDEVLERSIPFMVIIGEEELSRNVIKVKDMKNHSELEIPSDTLIAKLHEIGCRQVNAGNDTSFIEIMKQAPFPREEK